MHYCVRVSLFIKPVVKVLGNEVSGVRSLAILAIVVTTFTLDIVNNSIVQSKFITRFQRTKLLHKITANLHEEEKEKIYVWRCVQRRSELDWAV